MRSHQLIRIAAVVAMLVFAGGGVVATSTPAHAIPSCPGNYGPEEMSYGVSGGSPSAVVVDNVFPCIGNSSLNINLPVTISKYVGNSGWQVVATGKGFADYLCTGGRFLYTTSVTTVEGKPAFYCG